MPFTGQRAQLTCSVGFHGGSVFLWSLWFESGGRYIQRLLRLWSYSHSTPGCCWTPHIHAAWWIETKEMVASLVGPQPLILRAPSNYALRSDCDLAIISLRGSSYITYLNRHPSSPQEHKVLAVETSLSLCQFLKSIYTNEQIPCYYVAQKSQRCFISVGISTNSDYNYSVRGKE